MTTFRSFLTESTALKNDHMPHLEDLMLLYGKPGFDTMLVVLRELQKTVIDSKKASREISVSVKWDGAPAIVFGPDPVDGQFFVSTKSALNQSPKIAKTHSEIEERWSNQLVKDVLHQALDELPALQSPIVLQGDVLFADAMPYHVEHLEGLDYIVFTPNALTYALPVRDYDHRQFVFGIALHTMYQGDLTNMQSRPINLDTYLTLAHAERVWTVNGLNDMSRISAMSSDDQFDLHNALTQIVQLVANDFDFSIFRILSEGGLDELIKQYQNSLIRAGKTLNPLAMADDLWRFITEKRDKAVNSRKTARGQGNVQLKYELALNAAMLNRNSLYQFFALYQQVMAVKDMIIDHLNKAVKIPTFLKTPDGYKRTAPEGFVVTLRSGEMVKLVNRAYFSRLNFGVQTWHQE